MGGTAFALTVGLKIIAPRGRTAFILCVPTFGDFVTFNPHIHVLVAHGAFLHSMPGFGSYILIAIFLPHFFI